MRYLTVRLEATGSGAFHPLGKLLTEEPSIQREAIHHIELLPDDSVLILAEGSGDSDRYKELMADSSLVEKYLVSGGERWMATTQFDAEGPLIRFLRLRRDTDLVIEMPLQIFDDGAVRITFLGSDREFQQLYDRTREAETFEIEVLETGRYEPKSESFLRMLTSRQQEVLQVAVELGYYSNPREADHETIAENVGIAPTTVGSHLRTIEARVFEVLVR